VPDPDRGDRGGASDGFAVGSTPRPDRLKAEDATSPAATRRRARESPVRARGLTFREPRHMTHAGTADPRKPATHRLLCSSAAAGPLIVTVFVVEGAAAGLQAAAPPGQLARARIPRMGAGDELRCGRDVVPGRRGWTHPHPRSAPGHPTRPSAIRRGRSRPARPGRVLHRPR
jgi:hypothetical protein